MDKIDLTFGGKIRGFVSDELGNCLESKTIYVDYTIEGDSGKPTTTSLLLREEPLVMVTFDYQALKQLVEGKENASSK